MQLADLTWHCYMDLAGAAFYAGNPEEALGILERAAGAVAHLPPPNRRLAETLVCMGVLHAHAGRLAQAQRCFTQAVEILASDPHASPARLAVARFNLAAVLEARGRADEAARQYELAAGLARQASAAGDDSLAFILQELADIELAEGRRNSALIALREALRLHEQEAGPLSWEAAVCRDRLAEWYLAQGRYEEAEPLLWSVIRIKEALLGCSDPGLVRHYRRLGELYVVLRRYDQADRLLAHAARIALADVGQRGAMVGETLQALAQSQRAQVRPLLAEKLEELAGQATLGNLEPEVREEILELIGRVSAYLQRD